MKKFNKNYDGSVLFTVICLMSILTVVLMTAIVVVSSSNKKAVVNYSDNQVYITAKSTLDTFVDYVSDYSFTDFNSIRDEIDALVVNAETSFDVTLPSSLKETCKVTIKRIDSTKVIITTNADKNGQIATISREVAISSGSTPVDADIVFVFDCSGSMSSTDKGLAIAGAKDFAQQLLTNPLTAGHVRIGLVKFGTLAAPIKSLTSNKPQIDTALSTSGVLNPPSGKNNAGSTNIQLGIREAVLMLSSSPTTNKKFIVILGDGLPSYSYKVTGGGTTTDPYTFDESKLLGGGTNYNYYLKWSDNPLGASGWEDGNTSRNSLNQRYNFNGVEITNHKFATVCEAKNAQIEGCNIMTIGFGLKSQPVVLQANATDVLKSIADSPSYFFEADKTSESLTAIITQVVGTIANSATGLKYLN